MIAKNAEVQNLSPLKHIIQKQKINTMILAKRNYRAFDNIFDEFLNSWPKESWATPAVNVHETNDAFHLEVAAPGLKKEDFKISYDKGLLTVSFEKKNETEEKEYKTHRKEFAVTSFKRSFNVDEKIDVENIQAKYEDGILKLLLPKKEEVKVAPKEIVIH
jgi:HSP20 family protein